MDTPPPPTSQTVHAEETPDEFLAAHRLASATLPPARLRALLTEAGGSPIAAMAFSADALSRPPISLTEKQRERLREARAAVIAPQIREIAQRLGVSALLFTDAAYPEGLLPLSDAPPLLFVRGKMPEANIPAVAIVGSRRALLYGREQTERFARAFAEHGVAVVSGGAAGIDTAAHRGALDAGGVTLAVLGCGVDVAYPAANRNLFMQIVERGGALLSEFPVGTTPEPWRFPTRNRIIAGIAKVTVVAEAPSDSGALITARNAGEYGRDVWAIPGSIDSGRSRGCHLLIQDGAGLADSPADILSSAFGIETSSGDSRRADAPSSADSLPTRTITRNPAGKPSSVDDGASTLLSPKPEARFPKPAIPLSPDETALLAQLDETPRHLDVAGPAAGLAAPQASVAVTMLEMKGLIERRPGNLFVRRP